MVERGGLNYPIRVRDEFSKTTKLFRSEIRASKKEFRSFQAELRKGRVGAKTIRDTAAATQQLAKARRAAQKPLSDAERFEKKRQATLRNLNDQTRLLADAEIRAARVRKQGASQAETQERNAVKIAERAAKIRKKTADSDLKAKQAADPRFQAQKQLNAELFQEQILRQKINLLRAQGKAQIAGGDIVGGRATVQRAKDLEKSLKGSAKSANSLFFTFRRLVGTLAIFTLARKGVQTFNELVASGLRFNDTIEASTLGVGGLIATLGDVRNELGLSVGIVQELDLALGIARKQIELLRQDSLRTVATFSQLLDTFQVAVGPGLAAGLNLDEIRQLTVSISQAAAALSVPQNQLAEEIRSLLAGTIQARTTRIATALGITNADIRRLKEAGELFEFLDKQLEGFAESAQRQARQTLGGLQALLKGALEALVGEAAEPLFKELISLGNDILDNVLTIQDEFDNLQPNPEAVEALELIFNALRDGVIAAKEFAVELGFEGLQTTLSGAGAILRIILGIAKSIVATFSLMAKAVGFVRDLLGLSNEQMGLFAGFVAQAGTAFIILRKVLRLVGLDFSKLRDGAKKLGPILLRIATNPLVLVSAGIVAIVKATELWFEKLSGVDLGLGDTVTLVGVGLVSAFEDVLGVIQLIGVNLRGLTDSPAETAKNLFRLFTEIGLAVGSGLTGSETLQKALEKSLTDRAGVDRETGLLKGETELEQKIREGTEEIFKRIGARRKEREEQVANILAAADARKDAAGEEDPTTFDPATVEVGADFAAIVSTAAKPVSELDNALLKLTDDLRTVQAQFAQGVGAQGLGGQLEGIFREEDVESLERIRKVQLELDQQRAAAQKLRDEGLVTDERIFEINDALRQSVEDRQEALEALTLTEEEAQFVSLLRDQILLRDALQDAEQASFDLASARAALLAQQELPSLREGVALLNAEVAAETALTTAALANVGPREQAVVEARNAVAIAREELVVLIQRNRASIKAATAARDSAVIGSKEREVLQEALDLLEQRATVEQNILGLKTAQLDKEREIVELFESGTALQGARQGLIELAGELPSIFEVGLELTKSFVTSFANFAATEIVNAIVNAQQEGVDQSELFKQAAGRFAQELATQILQQVINNLIGLLLQATVGRAAAEATSAVTAGGIRISAATTAAAIEIAAATTAAAIRAASGGLGGHEGGFVQGFAFGGPVTSSSSRRPRGLHPADTIPAWLAPGEFVMRRAAVQALGLSKLNAMNGGNMPVTSSASAEAAGPAIGMQEGGLVSDRVTSAPLPEQEGGGVILVPAIVANDREMDQLTAGGSNALLAFMRENAGDINTLLDRGAGRG